MRTMKLSFSAIILFGFMFIIIGCSEVNNSSEEEASVANESNNDNNENDESDLNADQNEAPLEDVTLTLAWSADESEFTERIKQPVEDHFEHITLQQLQYHPGNEEDLQELIASQNLPDLWVTGSPGSTTGVFALDLAYDLNEMFDQFNFNLSRIEPNIVEELRIRSNEFNQDGPEILGALPLQRGLSALHYNKNVFDQFGVEYPSNGMMWDDAVNLAIQVTREEEGVQYHGLHADFHATFTQHAANHLGADGTPLFLTDPGFQMTLELMDDLFEMPGNYPENPGDMGNVFPDGILAMHAARDHTRQYYNEVAFDWDIVTFPTWPDKPGIGPTSSGPVIGIMNTSENVEEAFRVIDYLFSDEYHMHFSKEGLASPLVSPEINAVYGENLDGYRDNLNTDALFELTPQARAAGRFEVEHSIEAAGDPWHGRISHDYYDSEMDVGEFLLWLQERGQIVLEELQAQN